MCTKLNKLIIIAVLGSFLRRNICVNLDNRVIQKDRRKFPEHWEKDKETAIAKFNLLSVFVCKVCKAKGKAEGGYRYSSTL
jgi:hypothetical protein